MRTALITGVAATTLTPREMDFLRETRPAGLILFARNLVDHAQIRALVASVQEAVGTDNFLVLIDQEGGRVPVEYRAHLRLAQRAPRTSR